MDPAAAHQRFDEFATAWLATASVAPTTKELYAGYLDNHLLPTFGLTPLGAASTRRRYAPGTPPWPTRMCPPPGPAPTRCCANGSLPLEASIELLIRAFDGRFARSNQPWIPVESNGATWLDDQFLASSLGGLSGGERLVLTVVAALADTTGARRIDLADVVAGIDRDHLDFVLAALAHAGGSHQHSRLVPTGNRTAHHLEELAMLHPWPSPLANCAVDLSSARTSCVGIDTPRR